MSKMTLVFVKICSDLHETSIALTVNDKECNKYVKSRQQDMSQVHMLGV
jgi:hypothetical protein